MRIPLSRRNWERRTDDELRFHLDQQIRDYMDRGLSRSEAERRARQEFGTLELAKDECRDQRSTEWLNHILRDVRHACRSLWKSPGFATAVVATLALGIGANTAIFSLIYSVLLKPLPYPAPDRIFSVETIIPRQQRFPSLPMRVQDYLEWRNADTAFESIATLTPAQWNLTGDGDPERLGGALVSANFFTFLGATPQRGRGFAPQEETPGKQNVVVISDSLWRRRYSADPAVIGKTIMLNAVPHVVIGIAPASLLVPTGTLLHATLAFAPRIDVWQPIAPTNEELQGENWNYGILVRLRKGESAERGRQQLQAILNRSIRAVVPDFKDELTVRLVPIREIYSSKARLRLLLIFAASGAPPVGRLHEHRQPLSGPSGGACHRTRHPYRARRGPCTHREPSADGEPSACSPGRRGRRVGRAQRRPLPGCLWSRRVGNSFRSGSQSCRALVHAGRQRGHRRGVRRIARPPGLAQGPRRGSARSCPHARSADAAPRASARRWWPSR